LFQVNESLLRSIVTQPWHENYVYATDFGVLNLVRDVVLSKTCRVVVVTTTPPTPSVTWTPPTTVLPFANGSYVCFAMI